MRTTIVYLICFLACGILVAPAWARQGTADPLSGTWAGDWGPSARDRNEVTVQFKWDGKVLTGLVNPGPKAITLQKASFDAQTGAVHLEADATTERGTRIHYIIDGKLANNTLTGSWNHDNVKGDFKITKK